MTTPPPHGYEVPPPAQHPPPPPSHLAVPHQGPAGYPVRPAAPPYAQPGPPYPQPGYPYGYPPVPVSPSGQRLAEFVDRLLARLIDTAILGGAMMVIILPIYLVGVFALVNTAESQTVTSPTGRMTVEPTDPAAFLLQLVGLFALIMVLSLVLTYVYEVELMWRRGQTIGKRIMKIRVVLLDPTAHLTRWVAIKRIGTQTLCGFVPGLSLVDGLWQLWDEPYRQCLHDKAAATTVIKLNP